MSHAAVKCFRPKLAPLALTLISGLGFSMGVPVLAAPPAMFDRPPAALHIESRRNARPFPPEELPQAAFMLLAGGALMAFGLVGRKRKAEKLPERRLFAAHQVARSVRGLPGVGCGHPRSIHCRQANRWQATDLPHKALGGAGL